MKDEEKTRNLNICGSTVDFSELSDIVLGRERETNPLLSAIDTLEQHKIQEYLCGWMLVVAEANSLTQHSSFLEQGKGFILVSCVAHIQRLML